jgi:RNA polymerase sigma factor (sigma-70 family)
MEDLKTLVINAQSGDLLAFEQLVLRFRNMAYGYACSILRDSSLAEDVTQDAFLEAYANLKKLRIPTAFPVWFRKIVFKYCNRYFRQQKIVTVSLENVSEVQSTDIETNEHIEQHELEKRLLDMIWTLPENEREATILFYINMHSQKEISDFLNVPITTVKNRLRSARNQLKKGVVKMLNNNWEYGKLPESFAQRLLMFPFPRRRPSVKIEECSKEDLEVLCSDSQTFFYPLEEGGKCDWAFYDMPDERLSGAYECHVISMAKWKNNSILRTWTRYINFKRNDQQSWEEHHTHIENEFFHRIQLKRCNPGELGMENFYWENGELAVKHPMRLKTGMKYDELSLEVCNTAKVIIGDRSWKCLRVFCTSSQGKTNNNIPCVLAEWYVSEQGQTVFFRRYNGPGFTKPENPSSFEALKGMHEIEYNGITFRHAYDCIPDFALGNVLL